MKSTSTGLLTDMSGNIGCRPHDKIEEEPVHPCVNMDLSRNAPAVEEEEHAQVEQKCGAPQASDEEEVNTEVLCYVMLC